MSSTFSDIIIIDQNIISFLLASMSPEVFAFIVHIKLIISPMWASPVHHMTVTLWILGIELGLSA